MTNVGQWSSEVSARTLVFATPPPVSALTAAGSTSSSVKVIWTYTANTHTGFLCQTFINSVWVDWPIAPTDLREWTVYSLPPNTTVGVRISAVNAAGVSQYAEVWQDTTPVTSTTDLTQILVYENMSSVPIGESWSGYVPFGTSITKGSQEVPAITSDRVGKNEMFQGLEGYGRWGFTYSGFTAVEGDEIWFRVHELMPYGYDHYSYSAGARLKWMRMQTNAIADSSNGGYNDIYFDFKDQHQWKNIKEASTDGLSWVNFSTFPDPPLYDDSQWHSYEFYVKFSKNPANGVVRYWVDGVLAGSVNRATLSDPAVNGGPSDYHCTRLLYHTYWNGGCPKDQASYYDNVAIAMKIAGFRDDTPHLAQDAQGNLFIGSALL